MLAIMPVVYVHMKNTGKCVLLENILEENSTSHYFWMRRVLMILMFPDILQWKHNTFSGVPLLKV